MRRPERARVYLMMAWGTAALLSLAAGSPAWGAAPLPGLEAPEADRTYTRYEIDYAERQLDKTRVELAGRLSEETLAKAERAVKDAERAFSGGDYGAASKAANRAGSLSMEAKKSIAGEKKTAVEVAVKPESGEVRIKASGGAVTVQTGGRAVDVAEGRTLEARTGALLPPPSIANAHRDGTMSAYFSGETSIAPPTPVSPLRGAAVSGAVSLVWSPVDRAAGYEVFLAGESGPGGIYPAGNGTHWSPDGTLATGTWNWRVRAIGPDGVAGEFSEPLAFRREAPALEPLELKSIGKPIFRTGD